MPFQQVNDERQAMNETANGELQEAIYLALSTDAGLSAQLGGAKIYDLVPRTSKRPYVTIGISQEYDWSTSTEAGSRHIVTLHCWTDNQGRRQADRIIQAIRAIIEQTEFALTNHYLINQQFEFSDIRRDPDGQSIHGIIRYRMVTEPIL